MGDALGAIGALDTGSRGSGRFATRVPLYGDRLDEALATLGAHWKSAVSRSACSSSEAGACSCSVWSSDPLPPWTSWASRPRRDVKGSRPARFLTTSVREVGDALGLGGPWFNTGPAGLTQFGPPPCLGGRTLAVASGTNQPSGHERSLRQHEQPGRKRRGCSKERPEPLEGSSRPRGRRTSGLSRSRRDPGKPALRHRATGGLVDAPLSWITLTSPRSGDA